MAGADKYMIINHLSLKADFFHLFDKDLSYVKKGCIVYMYFFILSPRLIVQPLKRYLEYS